MPVAGPKPKEQHVHRVPPVHEWTEVPNVPYRGRRPRLPEDTPQATREWWDDVTRLPHCALWHKGDWRYALDTARVHGAFVSGDMTRAAEVRLRERHMGTTTDALRDLRIRYVEPQQDVKPATDTEPVDLDEERHRRLLGAG